MRQSAARVTFRQKRGAVGLRGWRASGDADNAKQQEGTKQPGRQSDGQIHQ
jgi:hypothetical protein